MAPFFTGVSRSLGGFGFGGKGRGRRIVITMWGGGGGGINFPGGSPTWGTAAPGGAGGSVIFTGTYSDINAASGQTLYLYVGGGGSGSTPGAGGPNGGHPGSGGSAGPGGAQGGGGGMSSIYLGGPFSSGTLLLIAGGGGAGYFESIATYPTGWVPPSIPQPTVNNGFGGSQSAGGAGGVSANPSYPPGSAGSQFTGGSGSGAANGKAGGGGAGWYGGGGGASDTGAATGAPGGGGSNYHNPIISPSKVAHANFFNDPWFNPGAPGSWPAVNASLGPLYSTNPAYAGTRSTLPGQNAPNPLYSLPYGGGSTVNGAGYPGSIHITVDGVTTSFTSVGPFTYTLP